MNKRILSILLCFFVGVACVACSGQKKNDEAKNKSTEADIKQIKVEQMENIKQKKFVSAYQSKSGTITGWRILYANKETIIISDALHLAVLSIKDDQCLVKKIIRLSKYDLQHMADEATTLFYFSEDGTKIFAYNDYDTEKHINASKNPKLKSYLFELSKDSVKTYQGQDIKEVVKKEKVSNEFAAVNVKRSEKLEKALKEKRIPIEEVNEDTIVSYGKSKVLLVLPNGKKDMKLGMAVYSYSEKSNSLKKIFSFI